ncbi:MAG: hypothetical protein ABIS69_01575 [Sediminibacterium sp.]
MKQKIGIIYNGGWSMYVLCKSEKYRDIYALVYIQELEWEMIKDYEALVIPFLSNQELLTEKKALIYRFLAQGKKVFVEGDSSEAWIDAKWEDRPVNNWWWVTDPNNPPISKTNHEHPVYKGLLPRHACWHTHGVYTRIPEGAEVIQENALGEVVTWQTDSYGGTLLVTTLDPFVEHGIQQITHLDHFIDNVTRWMCGITPVAGKITYAREDFGVETI